ncbi:hypothetical protein GCM10023185_22030 [Hymenobacter saemangeumensis]|uniref:DUF4345 domain-containing protein n=1 Tax=Hymenobacter saemangeumensis TaxID=1084522 RepID=A0ABP8IER5_9BACT
MARPLLLLVLFLAALTELGLAAGVFFAPAYTLGKLGILYSAEALMLSDALAWLLLLAALVAGMAFLQLWNRWPRYAPLCYLLGLWWVAVGRGIYFRFGRPEHLLLDSAKGLLIVLLTWRCQATRIRTRRY